MPIHHRRRIRAALLLTFGWIASLILFSVPAHAAADTVDEIHYSFGNTPDRVVFDWHGAETAIYYGLSSQYGHSATASRSAVTPVDLAGPFQEVQLAGLEPGTTYHYKIGAGGIDHTFTTAPTGSFTWVDVGDTSTTLCAAWMTQVHSLIAAQHPNFVTHGGDEADANVCGQAAVHRYYLEQQVWSTSAAFQPTWGNHEYGSLQPESLPGSARQTLENYKGRNFITNAQTVPADTATRTSHPGCGWATGSSVNTCRGEDWGYFTAGHVLYISYPENESGAQLDWGKRADPLMAAAQANANIDFIVTYGHRPAYTSLSGQQSNDLRTAINALAAKYSPTAAHPAGKYVLNVAHHAHAEEAFKPINGLVNITNGGGGSGLISFSNPPDPNSIFRLQHLGILSAQYTASTHQLAVNLVCGPAIPGSNKGTCTYGSVVYSKTFSRSGSPPPPPPPPPPPSSKQWVGNPSVETDLTGWGGKYGANANVTVTRATTVGHTGTASVKVTGLAGAANLSSGFNDNPRWVQSTTAGTVYTQSAWVDATFAGQQITMKLREWRASTLVVDRTVTLKAATAGWQQLSQTLTAAGSGDALSFAVYGNMSAGQSFYADDFSLTSAG